MATFSQLVPRRFERRIAKLAIIMFVETEGEWDGCEAHTLDISAQGARVQAGIEPTQGQLVKVVPREGSDPSLGAWYGSGSLLRSWKARQDLSSSSLSTYQFNRRIDARGSLDTFHLPNQPPDKRRR